MSEQYPGRDPGRADPWSAPAGSPSPGPAAPPYGGPPSAGYPAPPAHGYPPPAYGSPPPGYPVAQQYPSFPHAEPTPYHQMLRTWSYAWWKPVLGLFICLIGFVLIPSVVLVLFLLGNTIATGASFLDQITSLTDLENVEPVTFLGINAGLAAMIPLTWFCIRVLHGMRPRWLTSVVPKMRWKFFFACLAPAVLALIAQVVVGSLVPGGGGDTSGKLNHLTASTATFAIVVLLTTPLQAAGEEYLFRGYGMMAVGSLFPRSREQLAKWVAIGVTAVLFALAHGSQNFPLFFDRLAFGLIAAWLLTETGGIEAGLALHVLNNFLAFGFALAFGDLGEALSVTQTSWWQILVTVAQSSVYAVLVILLARRMRVQKRTRPPAAQPGPAPAGEVATA